MKQKLLILLAVVLVFVAMLACGTAGMNCYSTFPGCEQTAQAILDVTAAVATATAVAQ